MGGIHLSSAYYSWKTVKEGQWQQQEGITAEAIEALAFCQAWLQGQASFVVHTSGSTGQPKPITLLRDRMVHSARATGEALGLAPGDCALVCLPTQYIAGRMMLVRAMVWQLEAWLVPPTGNPLAHIPQGTAIHFTAMVPLQVQKVLKDPPHIQALATCKGLLIGGGPVSSTLEAQLEAQLPCPAYHTFGMTETITHIALRRLNGPTKSQLFTALPGVHFGIDNRKCLTITAPVTGNETLTTNDRVMLKDAQHFQWLGRVDFVVNTGGIKLQLEQVEKALEATLANCGVTARFFAAGLPDDALGQRLVLVVEGIPWNAALKQEIEKKIAERLEKYERPKNILFAQRFITTPTGKIQRQATLETLG